MKDITRSAIFCVLSLNSICVSAAVPNCPVDLLNQESGASALTLVEELEPAVSDQQSSECLPNVVTNFSLKFPLCSLGEVPVSAIGVLVRESTDKPVAAIYTSDYAPDVHAGLEQYLDSKYEILQPDNEDIPEKLRWSSHSKETTAIFLDGDTFITLEKPTSIVTAKWRSHITFIKADSVDLFHRDENKCKYKSR